MTFRNSRLGAMLIVRQLILLLVLFASSAGAHPVAQGSLEIDLKTGALDASFRVSNEQVFVAAAFANPPAAPAENLEALWKDHAAYLLAHVQVFADGVALPGALVSLKPPANRTTAGFVVYELRYSLPGGTPERVEVRQDLLNEIEFAPGNRWEATFVTRLAQDGRVVREGALLSPQQPVSWTLNGAPAPVLSKSQLTRDYLVHGVHHILAGWDHLLFMAALVLAVKSGWDLIAVVTAFTLAHTVTLTLATLRVVNLPSGIIEPMIAASIVAVAAQNLFLPRQTRGWPRLAAAFGFGLFHGLGFAGGLLEAMASLPGAAIATAIAAFSVGVELGHQVVVLPLFGLLVLLRRADVRAAERPWQLAAGLGRAASTLILGAGVYYFVLALR